MRKPQFSEKSSPSEIQNPECWLLAILLSCLALPGCQSLPDTSPSSLQQAEADLVLDFQSWNVISFLKPDVTGMANAFTFRKKTFTANGVVKLLRNLKIKRDFVVIVLDRNYSPDPLTTAGGMDAIQGFLTELGFRRIAFQDGAAWNRAEGMPILRDTTAEKHPS